MKLRRNSPSRRAFEAAAQGAHVPIALDAIMGVSEVTGPKKLGRMLGPEGDLNPSWAVLDAILEHDAGTVLAELCEALGFREPVREPRDPGALMERALEVGAGIEASLREFHAVMETMARELAKRPVVLRKVETGKGRAAG